MANVWLLTFDPSGPPLPPPSLPSFLQAFAVLLTTPLIFATTSSTSNPAAAQDQRLGFAEADFYPLTKTYGIPWAAFYAAPVGHYVRQ